MYWQMMGLGESGLLLVRLDSVTALSTYFSVAVLPQEDSGATSRLRAGDSLSNQFSVHDFIFRWL